MFGRYQSQTTRQLAQIQSSKYPDTNKDMEANLRRVNQFVDYIAQYLQVMQKGVDQANEDAIQRTRDMASDLVVLLGGGELLYGINLGDLQYFLPALGAIFGFDSTKPFPISLLEMAEHFFLGYIIPLDSFVFEIQSIIDGWLVAMGIDQDTIDAINELLDAIGSITADTLALFTDLWNLLDVFGINTDGFGPFADLWHTVTQLLGSFNIQQLGDLIDPVLHALAPWISELAQFVSMLDSIIKAFSGGLTDTQGLLNIAQLFTPFTDLMSGTFDPNSAWGDIITNALNPTGLISAVGAAFDAIEEALFGVTGGSQTELQQLGSGLMDMLGHPDLLLGDTIRNAEQMIANVLNPAGALSTSTVIPPHLFGNIMPGSQSVQSSNLLPDPGFDDPNFVDGEGLWFHSTTVGRTVNSAIVGSVFTTGDGSLRQLNGVPITTKPGQSTDFEVWTLWSGVVAGPGDAIRLCANAWDINHNAIADDANRVIQAIVAPATNQPTWQQLKGSYQAPAGTAYITICFEVTAIVTAGNVHFDDALQYLQGVIDSSWLGNVSNIPQIDGSSVNGMQGIEDLVTTFNTMFDGLGTALANVPKNGLDLSQLFNLMQTTAKQAVDAVNLAISHQQTLVVRNNKPVRAGMNPTSEATFHLTDFTAGGTTPKTAIAAGTAMLATFRPEQSAKKGFVEFLGTGNGGTGIFVNVYKVNPSTGVKTALWNSADIAALVPNGTDGYVRALIPGGSQPNVVPTDLLMFEIVNAGTGTLSVGTKQVPVPNHPSEYPPNFAATRTIAGTGGASPASINDSQITYNGIVPYINFGILDVPAGYMPNEVTEYLTDGTYTYTIPAFARVAGTKLDLVGLGAGGGGGGSGYFLSGEGGLGGAWNAITLVCGVDYPTTATTLTIVVGNGGNGGGGTGGAPGGATTITWTDPSAVVHVLTCAGGQQGGVGGLSNHGGAAQGIGPGDFTWQGQQYFGGPTTLYTLDPGYPGAGGSGAGPYANPGSRGADGYVSITARQT
jgi:hypothetical protein